MSKLRMMPTAADHFKGELTAPIKIVEYGDFECSFCAAAERLFQQLVARYERDVCFIYRHFPLRNSHPHAEAAALASEAAGLQGKFWEMHHILFQIYDRLSARTIHACAEKLGLDVARFQRDCEREDLHQRVNRDFTSGLRSGVNGTPTVFLNGDRYDQPIPSLVIAIEEIRRAS